MEHTVSGSKTLTEETSRGPLSDTAANLAVRAYDALSQSDPEGALIDMIKNDEIKMTVSDTPTHRSNVIELLGASSQTDAVQRLDQLSHEQKKDVTQELGALQRVTSLASGRAAVPYLQQNNLTSLAVANIPKAAFVSAAEPLMGVEAAAGTHDNATSMVVRNNATALRLLEYVRGTGLAAIDGAEDKEVRIQLLQRKLYEQGTQIDLSTLFGSMDETMVDDTTTVYSPASYFVDLLQYLRTSSTKPAQLAANLTTSGQQDDIQDSVLAHLFRRRPDLGNLELTPENTNVVVPYIDLANEVMESFIVYLNSYNGDVTTPKQVLIDACNNSADETSSESLSRPQYTKLEAYEKLAEASYPISLPYHQPLHAQRTFLEALKLRREDIINSFRPRIAGIGVDHGHFDLEKLKTLQEVVIDRAVDCERVGLSQEEYRMLTKSVFSPKELFELIEQTSLSEEAYRLKIGVPEVHECWGYSSLAEMQGSATSEDGSGSGSALEMVESQVLPRSGISYSELIDMLQTHFLNPWLPSGRSAAIFAPLRSQYKILQAMKDSSMSDRLQQLNPIISYLIRASASLYDASLRITAEEILQWVTNEFENLGKLLVLSKNESPTLEISGWLAATNPGAPAGATDGAVSLTPVSIGEDGSLWNNNIEYLSGLVGKIEPDGAIVSNSGQPMGRVMHDGSVQIGDLTNMQSITKKFPKLTFEVINDESTPVGLVHEGSLYIEFQDGVVWGLQPVTWLQEDNNMGSDISKVRLLHLDGTSLEVWEWDRIYCFRRLQSRLGWSISDTGRLLSSRPLLLSDNSELEESQAQSESGLDTEFISALSAVLQILSLCQLSAEELLTFWAPLSYEDPKSLYQKLFVARRVGKVPAIFLPDANGVLFSGPEETITEHRFTVRAAFGLRSVEDLTWLIEHDSVPDKVNLDTLSAIYRRALLARVLHVGIPDLAQVVRCFGDPFSDPKTCLVILQEWNKIASTGMTWSELRYVCDASQNSDDPLVPTMVQSLSMSKSIATGITAISTDHSLINTEADASIELVTTKASLLYESDIVSWITSFIAGSTTYSVSVPAIDNPEFIKMVSSALSPQRKLVYALPQKSGATVKASAVMSTRGKLSFQGILTADEVIALAEVVKAVRAIQPPVDSPKPKRSDGKGDGEAPYTPPTQEEIGTWVDAITRARKQPAVFYFDNLSGILPEDIQTALLQPDIDLTSEKDQSRGATSASKALCVLQWMIPRLQRKLAHELVVSTVASQLGFKDKDMAGTLLDRLVQDFSTQESAAAFLLEMLGENTGTWRCSFFPAIDGAGRFVVDDGASPAQPDSLKLNEDVLTFSQTESDGRKRWVTKSLNFSAEATYALETAMAIKDSLQLETDPLDPSSTIYVRSSQYQAWSGFLVSSKTETYTLSVTSDTQPHAIGMKQGPLGFVLAQEDPEMVWSTERSVTLKSGEPCAIALRGLLPEELWWKPSQAARQRIPSSSYFQASAHKQIHDLLNRLKKLAILLKRVPLSEEEVGYISQHPSDFEGMAFGKVENATQLAALCDFVDLRRKLSPLSNDHFDIVDLMQWASVTVKFDEAALAQQISRATGWKPEQIVQIVKAANFGSKTNANLCHPQVLSSMQRVVSMSNSLGVDIPQLFNWATPLGTGDFDRHAQVAAEIQKAAQSKFAWADWDDAVRPLNDKLREKQRQALVDYLLVQQPFVSINNIRDADSLFEFFLIDVQMTPLVETSRIKQAISSVQLFVTRALLGLEKDVPPTALNRQRWEWMQKYRVWEANRKVFLYPENWIEPSLRDDKSEFFRQMESELLQKDLSPEAIMVALRSFVHSLQSVSNLVCMAFYVDVDNGARAIHVFARTPSSPFKYFYNRFIYTSGADGNWRGWETMDVDIPHYEIGESGFSGSYLCPAVFQGRLIVFMGELIKTTAGPKVARNTSANDLASSSETPRSGWSIRLGWTEYARGKWTPRQTCPQAFFDPPLVEKVNGVETTEYAAVASAIADAEQAYKNKQNEYSGCLGDYQWFLNNEPQNLPGSLERLLHVGRDVEFLRVEWERLKSASTSHDGAAPADSYGFVSSRPKQTPDAAGSKSPIKIYLGRSLGTLPWSLLNTSWIFDGSHLYRQGDTQARSTCPDDGTMFRTTFGQTTADRRNTMTVRNNFGQPVTGLGPFIRPLQAEEGPTMNAAGILDLARTTVSFRSFENGLNVSAAADDVRYSSPELDAALDLRVPLFERKSKWQGTLFQVKEPLSYRVVDGVIAQTNAATKPQEIFDALAELTSSNQSMVKTNYGGNLYNASPDSSIFSPSSSLFSNYNWELGLHTPMAIVDRLFKAQQYEEALAACHYVFNPLKSGPPADLSRVWVFPPFKYIGPSSIEDYMLRLKDANTDLITTWRDNPFQPHAVARGRPQSYMKWMVMKYIEILIAYADSLFRQNTLETNPTAIQYYVLASHLYGPRGQKIPPKKQSQRQKWTYNLLSKQFDAFSNAIVQLEEAFPFSSQSSPSGLDLEAAVPFTNIWGSVGSLAFSIPDNPQLRSLAETIDDRLFKIRHSQDINGIFRQLPLFEPPIDPALLVRAQAQGLSLSSVAAGLSGPMPNNRFQYLLQRAIELASQVQSLGQQLLSAREKGDAEALAVLRAQYDISTQDGILKVKKLAVDEALQSVEVLLQNRAAAEGKMRYYLALVDADIAKVPAIDQHFTELESHIEKPVDEGGLALSPYESEEMQKLQKSNDMNTKIAKLEISAAALRAYPAITASFQPLGVGIQVTGGFTTAAEILTAVARGLSMTRDQLNFESNLAGRRGQHQRVLQERIMMANMAGYEVAGIDKQVTSARIRIAMAEKEMEVQQRTMDHNNDTYDFLRQKYTNQELYTWMDGAVSAIHSNAYAQAIDLALKVQKVFQFERPNNKLSFIQSNYWDASRSGLLSGEMLTLALRQLETAYNSERGYDFEVTKAVSLRKLDPMALIRLRETGTCRFDVPEVLFDMDFPGHYMRRIKSASVTMPCLVGPYTNVNATLRLRSSRYRVNPSLAGQYPEAPEASADPDPRFSTANVPISAISVSSAQADAGVFELTFRDTFYMPFEGAGAISSWQLDLPPFDTFRQFDYNSITDVILHLKYTALDGGEALQKAAIANVHDYIAASDYIGAQGGLVAVFDIKNEFGSSWTKAVRASTTSTTGQTVSLPDLNEKLPAFTSPRGPDQIAATAVWLISDKELPGKTASLVTSEGGQGEELSEAPGVVEGMYVYQNNTLSANLGSWKLTFGSGSLVSKTCWMLVRYTLSSSA